MAPAILLIEDEDILADNIKRYLERRSHDVVAVASGARGLSAFDKGEFDLVLLDLNLPDIHGIEVLRQLRQRDSQAKVICVTGNGSVQVAVDAMKAGAHDYVTKPVVLSELQIQIDKALSQNRLEGALTYYSSREASGSGLDKLIGHSPVMLGLRTRIGSILEAEKHLVDGNPPAVLIRGETGTGKDLAARAFHFDGSRRAGPFIEFNCAAMPVSLVESELFGHERGAFTDAKERKMGLVEAADGGTLFLDEIGDTDPAVQLKLLKLLENRVIRRLGGVRDRAVNVRFISATNRPLEQLVQAGQFRSDLFYRLRVVTIDMPPLRAREGDIELLAQHFLALHARRYGRPGLQFSSGALKRIRTHTWPGNVRELRNVVEQAVLSAHGKLIEEDHLGIMIAPPADNPFGADADGFKGTGEFTWGIDARTNTPTLDTAERALIDRALCQSKGNVTLAAKVLGVSRDTLRYRMEKYGFK